MCCQIRLCSGCAHRHMRTAEHARGTRTDSSPNLLHRPTRKMNSCIKVEWQHASHHTHLLDPDFVKREDRGKERWRSERKRRKTRGWEINTTRTVLCNVTHPYACMHIKTHWYTLYAPSDTHALSVSRMRTQIQTHTHTHTVPIHLTAAGFSLEDSRGAVTFIS